MTNERVEHRSKAKMNEENNLINDKHFSVIFLRAI